MATLPSGYSTTQSDYQYPKLIKRTDRPEIYEYGPTGYEHVPDWEEFLRRGYNLGQVKQVPALAPYMGGAEPYMPPTLISDYPKLIRQSGRPEIYEYGPYGYEHIPSWEEYKRRGYTDTSQVRDVPSVATYMYDPLYKKTMEQTGSYYDTLQEQLEHRLKGEYAKRGILDSGLYGKALARSTTELAGQRGGALADIMKQRLGEYREEGIAEQEMLTQARQRQMDNFKILLQMYGLM